MFCKNCGNQINNGENNCSRCGTSVVISNNNMESNVNVVNNNCMNNSISSNVGIQNQPQKKVSFFNTYLKILGISVIWFFVMTIISIAMGNSGNNTMSFAQIGMPILINVYGFIGTLIYTAVKNRNQKKSKALKIVLIVIGVIIAFYVIMAVVILVSTKRYECKSSQEKLILFYKDDKVRTYTAENIQLDFDKTKEFVEEYGIDEYFKYLKQWFESETGGTCEYK